MTPDSSPVPPEAVTAAAEAIHRTSHERGPCGTGPMPSHIRFAEAALEAAAPAIRAGERKRLASLAQDREGLGELVRRIWVDWAATQPDAKPSWLTEWKDLDNGQREVDMLIGGGIAAAERARIAALLRKIDHWHELDWVIASLAGDGPEPVLDSFGMLSLPSEVQQAAEAALSGDDHD